MFSYGGNSNDEVSGNRPAEIPAHHTRPSATAGLLQGAAANARRIIMAFPPVNDENQQNVRIQQAVNRYNGNLPGYCRSSAAYKCSLFRNKVNKPVAQHTVDTTESELNPETRYPSAGPGHLPVVFFKQTTPRPIKYFKTLAKMRTTDVAGLPSSRFLDDTSDKYSDMKSTRSVLEVLHDLSRKRIHGKDESENSPKRRCRGLAGEVAVDGQVPYRPLFIPKSKVQFSPKKDQTTQTQNVSHESGIAVQTDEKSELRRKLAQKNNEIMASLSSSTHVMNNLKRKRVPESEPDSARVDVNTSVSEKKAKESPKVTEDEIETPVSPKEYKANTGPRSPPTKDKFMRIYWDGSNNAETKRQMLETLKNNPGESQFKNSRPASDPLPGTPSLTAAFGFSPISSAASANMTSASPMPILAASPPASPPAANELSVKLATSPSPATPQPSPLPTATANFAVSEWSTAPKPKSQFVNTSPNTSRFSANLTPTVTKPLLFGSSTDLSSPPKFAFTADDKKADVVDFSKTNVPVSSPVSGLLNSSKSSIPLQPHLESQKTSQLTAKEVTSTTADSIPKAVTPDKPSPNFSFGITKSAPEIKSPTALAAEPVKAFSFSATKTDSPIGSAFSFGSGVSETPLLEKANSIEAVKSTLAEEKPSTFALATSTAAAFALPKPTGPSFTLAANNSSPSVLPTSSANEVASGTTTPSAADSPTPNLFSFGAKTEVASKPASNLFSFGTVPAATSTASAVTSLSSDTGKSDDDKSKKFSVFARLGDKSSSENGQTPATTEVSTAGFKLPPVESSISSTTTTSAGLSGSSFPSSTTAVQAAPATGMFSFGNNAATAQAPTFGATSNTTAPPAATSLVKSTVQASTGVSPAAFSFGKSIAAPSTQAFSFGKSDTTASSGAFTFGAASTQKLNPFGAQSPGESANPSVSASISTAPKETTSALPTISTSDASKPFQVGSSSLFGKSGGISTGLFGSTQSQPQSAFPTSTPVVFSAGSQIQKDTAPTIATTGFTVTPAFGFGAPKTATTTAPLAFGSSASIPSFGAVTTAGAVFGSSTFASPVAQPLTFGSSTTTAPALFATTTPSVMAFGQTPSSKSTFGTFGVTTSSTFASATPAFGATNPPVFGAATSTTSTFGTASTPALSATPAFGTSNPPAFGAASSTATNGTFGTTSPPVPAFGSSTPAFGISNPPAFGAASSTTTNGTFGATSAPVPSFGSSTPAFGTSSLPAFGAANTTATSTFGSGAANPPSFNSPMSFNTPGSATSAFGSSTASSSSAGSTPFGFGASPSTSSGVFSFGSAPAPASAAPAPFAFGSTAANKTETNSMFSFGSNSTPSPAQPSGGAFAFGAAASTSNQMPTPGTSGVAAPFGAGAPSLGAFSVPGTFSIGTGSSQSRRGARVRRKQ